MTRIDSSNCNCEGGIIPNVIQCRSCGCSCTSIDLSGNPIGCSCSPANLLDITQKRIWNVVRVPQSEYTMNLGSLSVYQRPNFETHYVNWNQASDRVYPSNSNVSYFSNANVSRIRTVPSRGNSTKRSITRERPGSQAPGGKGVDIKHNSYDRYLARLKGKGPLRTQTVTKTPALYGAKIKAYGIVGSSNRTGSCLCFS